MWTRYGWPGALIMMAVGFVVWYLIAPLFTVALLVTIVQIIGILMVVVGAINLVACFLGSARGPRV